MSFANCDSIDECDNLQKEYNYQLDELQKQIKNIKSKIENIIETTNSLKLQKRVEYKKQVEDLKEHLKNEKIQDFLLNQNCDNPDECRKLLEILINLKNNCNNKNNCNIIEQRINITNRIQSFVRNQTKSTGGKYKKTKKSKITNRKTKKK